MSEPKPERISEAELDLFGRSSTEASQLRDLHAIDRLVAEVRRLRGLIVAGFTAPSVTHWLAPDAEKAWVPGYAVQDLVSEAEAIRAEPANPLLTRPDPQA